MIYSDPVTLTRLSVEDVQTLVAANDFAHIHMQYVTSYGDSVLRSYYMDPLTLFLNVMPPEDGPAVQHSPLEFLREQPIDSAVGTSGIYLFAFGDSGDQFQATISGSSVTVNPVDGTLFSKSMSTSDGWTLDASPAGLKVYTFIRPVFPDVGCLSAATLIP